MGKAMRDKSTLVSYPRQWIHPKDMYIHPDTWIRWTELGILKTLPKKLGFPDTMNTMPDLD